MHPLAEMRLKPRASPADCFCGCPVRDDRRTLLGAENRTDLPRPDEERAFPMPQAQFSMREEEFAAIQVAIDTLLGETEARGIFVVDRVGQLISQTGRTAELDTTGLATLAAGSIAATGGLAQLLGEDEFPTHFHQGERGSLHMNLVGERGILIVVFEKKSSLGLVRLRARKASTDLAQIFEIAQKKSEAESPSHQSGFGKLTDEEIDNLFSD